MASQKKELFEALNKLDTEQRNPLSSEIDLSDPLEIATLMNQEDQKVALRVQAKLNEISEAIELVSERIALGGRLLYFGAGTSGRLGVLDAAECPPTFGTEPEQVQGFIAGGKEAMFVAQEGAEDSEQIGANDLIQVKASSIDVVCGLAASGRTPYVLGALKKAQELGIKTIFITTVPEAQLSITADVVIDVPVGPEVIMGSTRLKSGTAQKMVLNMITTGAFIRQGKVLENVMVDLKLSNKKLEERAKRIIMSFGDVSYDHSEKLLSESNGHVKTALVMSLLSVSKEEASQLLKENKGFIRKALQQAEK
ncbi:MAG: N-acetylmuramic acid 6-phosphate etherase [Balneolaceae bacterium]|nr:N-acetylmuramic acid 6-phosphate etherase [Balneolaceae bacterium]MBO6546440.1 N-acetylmuramic acid 6-phosphate etherase [Balneolaceae bacterium]MBO6648799.1 N-acetylmuramic acid 6-phosphate etherase [Balneolaceae bacterium]